MTPPPEPLPFPSSLCHRCAAPPRYVQTKSSTFILCPLLPQKYAELMAGRFPSTSADEPLMPGTLTEVMIGEKTAREINWLR